MPVSAPYGVHIPVDCSVEGANFILVESQNCGWPDGRYIWMIDGLSAPQEQRPVDESQPGQGLVAVVAPEPTKWVGCQTGPPKP